MEVEIISEYDVYSLKKELNKALEKLYKKDKTVLKISYTHCQVHNGSVWTAYIEFTEDDVFIDDYPG
jgi:hypothetical protein